MHSCASYFYTSTPTNNFGFQAPRSGVAYVGIITHQSSANREYISARLVRPMTKDSIYRVSFFVNAADGGNRISSSGNMESVIAVSNIGAYISDTLPHSPTLQSLSLNAQVINSAAAQPLTDTTRWYEVTGNYTAKGGERWITIGCVFYTGESNLSCNSTRKRHR